MGWGEKADAILEVEVVGHVTAGTWIKNIFYALSGSTPEALENDLNVKVRATGEVIYSVRVNVGMATDEGVRGIEEDLKALNLEEFCQKYGISVPESTT